MYVRLTGQARDNVHRCFVCPTHPTFHWNVDDCSTCERMEERRRLWVQLYDGNGRMREPCPWCGNIGGYHYPRSYACQWKKTNNDGLVVVGRYWRILADLVPMHDVGGIWYHRLVAPRWAVLIAQATDRFPSAAERRGLVRWARSCSEGRQTLLYSLTRTRLTLQALQGEDVRGEHEWIAQ